jgi:cytochrome oxidase Cu insertion factor (SCO1/SenC/PrrC family)
MAGMNTGLDFNDPTVVAAFRAALAHQGLIALIIIAVLSLVWVAIRRPPAKAAPAAGLAAGREALRIGFGLLWVLDALLLTQSGMAAGLPSQVIEPAAAASPGWVQGVVGWAGTAWAYHPVQAGCAAVCIEAGIGIWLLAARRGPLSRLAGAASLGWGLVVWVFGEAFGGIFAPGLSWLSGAPGAALPYAVAGALLAAPEGWWRSARLGRILAGAFGLFLVGMAVLQAWPGRGFWSAGSGSPLTQFIQAQALVSQPSFIASVVSDFGSFAARAAVAVNLVTVIALAATGLAFLSGRQAVVRQAVVPFGVLCLLCWLVVQDLGFFGGLGTDPGSMIPMALLAVSGSLALTRPAAQAVPAQAAAEAGTAQAALAAEAGSGAAEQAQVPVALATPEPGPAREAAAAPGRDWLGPVRRASFGAMVSAAAAGVIVLGVVPMAAAQASTAASPILAQAIAGSGTPVSGPASNFTLTDQNGQTVSLAGLRGKVVLLTFLDPVCVSECPLIAQEFKQAGQILGASNSSVEMVCVNLNPTYSDIAYIQAFDQQEGLNTVSNWRYLTGSPKTLEKIYAAYGVASEVLPAGAMLGHSDVAFVISRSGQLVQELNLTPGPGTAATRSSFGSVLAGAATQALGSAQ